MKIFTYNIDWAKSNAQERGSIKSILSTADVIMFQEAKHIDLSAVLNDEWLVHQNISDHAKQGVAVAWRKKSAHRHHVPGVRGRGYVIGVTNHGLRLLPRYFNYRDLAFRDGRVIRFVSTHRPPQRFRRLWGIFDWALARFLKKSPYPVIVGMDSNEHTHAALAKLTHLTWHGIGIDGFLVSKSIKVHGLKAHPKANSDHHPISIDI